MREHHITGEYLKIFYSSGSLKAITLIKTKYKKMSLPLNYNLKPSIFFDFQYTPIYAKCLSRYMIVLCQLYLHVNFCT